MNSRQVPHIVAWKYQNAWRAQRRDNRLMVLVALADVLLEVINSAIDKFEERETAFGAITTLREKLLQSQGDYIWEERQLLTYWALPLLQDFIIVEEG